MFSHPSMPLPSRAGNNVGMLLGSTWLWGLLAPVCHRCQVTSAPCHRTFQELWVIKWHSRAGGRGKGFFFSQLSCRSQLHQNRAVVQRHFVSTDIISSRFFFPSTAGSSPGKCDGKGGGVAAERGCCWPCTALRGAGGQEVSQDTQKVPGAGLDSKNPSL